MTLPPFHSVKDDRMDIWNFNDLYLKSNIGKVSHYRPGILFDHLICLNISVRLKGAYGKAGIWNPESGIRNPEPEPETETDPEPEPKK